MLATFPSAIKAVHEQHAADSAIEGSRFPMRVSNQNLPRSDQSQPSRLATLQHSILMEVAAMGFMTIEQIDGLLQAAQTFRASELGRARDGADTKLIEQVDADGSRLGAFTIGVLEALLTTHDAHVTWLPYLAYALVLVEHGSGARAVEESRRLIELQRARAFRDYVQLGRRIAMRAFVGEPAAPGGFARLLASETQIIRGNF